MNGDAGGTAKPLRLPSCPYRRAVDAAPGTPAHIACDCAGGIPIALDDRDPRLREICGSCNVPSAIDPARRSCLFLVPVRIWEGGTLRSGFSCRWFHNLKPKRLPKEAWLCCAGCPHWFPRPPDERSIPRMNEWIHRIIRGYWEPERPAPVFGRPPMQDAAGLREDDIRRRIRRYCELFLGKAPVRGRDQSRIR